MRNQDELATRVAILALTEVGKSQTLVYDGGLPDDAAAYAKQFAKRRRIYVTVVQTNNGITVTRIGAPEARKPVYPEIDALAVGGSHLFALPAAMHQRIRQAASFRNKAGDVRLSCTTEAGGIRVTRLPMGAEEQAACGPITAPVRASRWGLERLATEPELRITLTPADQNKLRLAATAKSKATGWTIRCRLQDDGAMLVYRTDAGAPQAQAA